MEIMKHADWLVSIATEKLMNTLMKAIVVVTLLLQGVEAKGAEYLTESQRRASERTIIFYRNPPYTSDGWQALAPGFSIPPKHRSGIPSPTFGPEIGFAAMMEKTLPDRRFAFVKGSRNAF